MERDRIKFKSNVEGKIQFMNKLCTVKIDWCHLGLFGNKEIEKSETKLFSTQEKAEQFLVNSGFLYGVPYPFKICGSILEDLNSLYVIDFLLQPQK